MASLFSMLCSQLMILASAVCMSLAYPGYEQYHYGGGHEVSGHSGGYEGGYGDDGGEADYGHHQVASQRIGESHGHEFEHHHEEDEHVDYYVSSIRLII